MNRSNEILTVTQLNEYIKLLLESSPILENVWIRGEVSNFTNHYRTGHFYFSLKDENSLIRAVMFRFNAQRIQFEPQNGMKVLLRGRVSSYVRDGQYQVYVEEMIPDGVGSLALAFEQLRRKLSEKGLFDEDRKKPLPSYPKKIGIITSPTGAAIRDMINIIGRRFPCAEIYLYPSLVQGDEAPGQLIEALEFFNATKFVDVIIIGRGGGSMEDLWAFNNEELAYAVAESDIPVISAVGHETDFTICDFVADRRAPTPSAAAELAVPDRNDLKRRLVLLQNKMTASLSMTIDGVRGRLKYLSESGVLSGATSFTNERRMRVLLLSGKLDSVLNQKTLSLRSSLEKQVAGLEAMSPLAVLGRGYSILTDAEENVVRSVEGLSVGSTAHAHLCDGTVDLVVEKTEKEKRSGKNSKKF